MSVQLCLLWWSSKYRYTTIYWKYEQCSSGLPSGFTFYLLRCCCCCSCCLAFQNFIFCLHVDVHVHRCCWFIWLIWNWFVEFQSWQLPSKMVHRTLKARNGHLVRPITYFSLFFFWGVKAFCDVQLEKYTQNGTKYAEHTHTFIQPTTHTTEISILWVAYAIIHASLSSLLLFSVLV